MWMMQPRALFSAIRQVETGGHPDPSNAVGDGGLSLGPYQITRAYWLDAVTHAPEIGGRYDDVRGAAYAERIMMAYWDRYAPDDHAETLARIHNGGPRGHKRGGTDVYWQRVSQALDALHFGSDSGAVGSQPRSSSSDTRTSDQEATSGSTARSGR